MTGQEVIEDQRQRFPVDDVEMWASPNEINNCIINLRATEKRPLFYVRPDGWCKVFLDGYAIIPIEEYEDLQKRAA